MRHFIFILIYFCSIIIADPELTRKFIQNLELNKFKYDPETGIVICEIANGISGSLKLSPNMSPAKVLEVLQPDRIKYHGPINFNLVRFALDADIAQNLTENSRSKLL